MLCYTRNCGKCPIQETRQFSPSISQRQHKTKRTQRSSLGAPGSKKWGIFSRSRLSRLSPRGIKPIVEKLPAGLQDKWLFASSRYTEEHRVTFPPFNSLLTLSMVRLKQEMTQASSCQTAASLTIKVRKSYLDTVKTKLYQCIRQNSVQPLIQAPKMQILIDTALFTI